MKINIEQYLTEDQIRLAIRDEIKQSVKNYLSDENGFKRIISNAVYESVSNLSDDEFNTDLKHLLKENLNKVVSNLSHSTVFKSPNAWDTESNSAYKFLQKCFEEMKPEIKERFKDAVNKGIDAESTEMIKNELHGVFMEWADNKFLNQ